MKVIPLRFPGRCRSCTTSLPAGSRAFWDWRTKQITCLGCLGTESTAGDEEEEEPDGSPVRRVARALATASADGLVQFISAVAAGGVLAVLGLTDPDTVLRMALIGLVVALVAALVDSARESPSAAWRIWKRVAAGLVSVLIHTAQLVLGLVALAMGVSWATRSQVGYQHHLVTKHGRGYVVWWSRPLARRNIDRLEQQAGRRRRR